MEAEICWRKCLLLHLKIVCNYEGLPRAYLTKDEPAGFVSKIQGFLCKICVGFANLFHLTAAYYFSFVYNIERINFVYRH
jgi:hypothetical protein